MEIIQDPKNRAVYLKIGSINRDIIRGVRKAYYFIGKDLKSYSSQKILEKPKSGRTYIIRTEKRKRKHVASAPGEFPANMTGKLRKSIGYKVAGWSEMEFGGETEYAKYLELGTKKMEKRSFLMRSVTERQGISVNYFYSEIDRSLKQNG